MANNLEQAPSVHASEGECEKTPNIGEEETSSAINDKRLLRRIDVWICPMMAFSMSLQFLDKSALPAASILGIIEDLGLVGNQYSWANSIFAFGYLSFTFFTGYLMVRLPIAKLLVGTFFIWAVLIGCHAATKNFTGIMVVRFFLGAAEAAAIPGFSLMTGMWYKRKEHPLRHGFWFLGTSLGIMLAGLLSFGVAHIGTDGGSGPWKWLFIALAILTAVWASLMLYFLPDTPGNARFLSAEQKIRAVERVKATNQSVTKSNQFHWGHFLEAVLDIKIWLIFFFLVCVTICNSSLTAFSQIVLVGLGFNVKQANLFTIATGGLHGLFGITASWLCTKYRNIRAPVCIVLCTISLTGSLLVRFGPNLGSKLFGFLIFYAYPCTVSIALSIIASNTAGFTKKSVATSMSVIGYSAGNIVGPFAFLPSERPAYPTGFTTTTCCFGAAILLMSLLIVAVRIENSRRDRKYGTVNAEIREQVANEILEQDLTDGKNTNFRYVY
ncbi:hypothetical protein B0A52_09791 [Exophiala mesophila]|uniref:Major facilitator superfamily (MFS) profile domain-containing protein n=1 Tax=Exophiala mesophila TaxID=212818 RepID=A0A438MS61_EXOME|nr:hypothetical protein B0A52_09791 [Exophiala mesophila]